MNLDELETPALVLDADRVEANVARMRAKITALGVSLRPHVKTCKNVDIARLMLGAARGPITVSTLKEAEYFAGHGFTDIFYAVGITPNKLDHAARLMARGVDLTLVLDSVDAARAVSARGRALGVRYKPLIEIDCDGHRSGIRPGDALLLEVARALDAKSAPLAGVMTHAGDAYNCAGTDAIVAMAEQERRAVVDCAQALRAAHVACPVVSVGSTPTATFARSLAGVTEVRAGVYVFFDLVMAGLGVCRIEDLAASVLTSVIGHQKEKGWIIVDAGWMAMSRDRGTAKQRIDQGYGLVCDIDGAPLGDLIMADANQEHGVVAVRGGNRANIAHADVERFPVGSLLRILPNHACATAAQHNRYHVVRGGRAIEAVWPRFGGW
jgi:D-serine deaminase-like pyridoxal phosphate-dependent protein